MTEHERGYINGLEDWVMRVEAENKKLRVKCETVHELVKSKHRLERAIESERETSRKLRESRDQLGALLKAARDELAELRNGGPQGFLDQVNAVLSRKPVDVKLCQLAFHTKIVVDTVDEQKLVIEKQDTEIGVLRDKVATQRRTMSQIRAALEGTETATQVGEPLHPLASRALALANYVAKWEVVASWVADNLNVGRGELSSSHMITMFKTQKVEIDKLKAELAEKDRAIKACADATRLFW